MADEDEELRARTAGPDADAADSDGASSQQDRTEARAGTGPEDETEDEPVETPFDHPLFLPAVLLGLSLWFLWDGFIVPMEDHLAFNRWGFGVLAVATLYFGFRGFQELRARRDEDGSGS